MKYIASICLAIACILFLNACGVTSGTFSKTAYVNNDAVKLPGEQVNDITLIAVSYKSDKALYEIICSNIQSGLNKKNVSSDMRFYNAEDGPAEIARKIRETTKPYYLVIDKLFTGTQKDELNNDMIVNQVNCMLQKQNGEHVADFTISIADNKGTSVTGKNVASVIIDYLSKHHFI